MPLSTIFLYFINTNVRLTLFSYSPLKWANFLHTLVINVKVFFFFRFSKGDAELTV